MTRSATRRARILTVGAYERDNFGDLLFLLVTEKYLPDAEIVAAAPFAADMTELLDREVPRYGPLLQEEAFDAVWTVGGQVGGTNWLPAYRMSHSPEEYAAVRAASVADREETIRRAAGLPVLGPSPYLPSVVDFPLNAGALSLLNSVGLAGIRNTGSRRDALVRLLRDQDDISVRDKESHDYLKGLSIEHTLVPDAVHAISRLQPASGPRQPDVAVFQASRSILTDLGHAAVAERLVGNEHLRRMHVKLLLAGAAVGHDSVEDFERVIDHARRIDPAVSMEIVLDRRPLDLVDHLATAGLVIGTSLHVRIISGAYGVPRLTLARNKPTRYARHWDPVMPYGVTLDSWDDDVARALSLAEDPAEQQRSEELSRRADEHLTDLADRVRTRARQRTTDGDERERAAFRRYRAAHEARTRNPEVQTVRAELTRTLDRLEQAERERKQAERDRARSERELARIKSSRTYRAAHRMSRARGRVSRATRRALRAPGNS